MSEVPLYGASSLTRSRPPPKIIVWPWVLAYMCCRVLSGCASLEVKDPCSPPGFAATGVSGGGAVCFVGGYQYRESLVLEGRSVAVLLN